MATRYLDQYFDPTLELEESLTKDVLVDDQLDRLVTQYHMAAVAEHVPRRLSEATRDELSLDKKRSRRIKHVLFTSAASWGASDQLMRDHSEEERKAGAQVNWVDWFAEQRRYLERTRRVVATWAKKTGNVKDGKKMVTRISNEIEWLSYALRD